MKTGLNDILDFYVKTFEKHQNLRNLTCLYIALNPIKVDSNIKLVNILIKLIRYHVICFHGNDFTSATVIIF